MVKRQKLKGKLSQWREIISSFPQGTVLIFNTVINNWKKVRKFAADKTKNIQDSKNEGRLGRIAKRPYKIW